MQGGGRGDKGGRQRSSAAGVPWTGVEPDVGRLRRPPGGGHVLFWLGHYPLLALAVIVVVVVLLIYLNRRR